MKLFFAVLILFAGMMPAAAQWLDRPWPGIPRTAEGNPDLTAPTPRGPDGHPDLTGVWERAASRRSARPRQYEAVGQRACQSASTGLLQGASLLSVPAKWARG